MKKIEIKFRKSLRKIFNGISLTAVAFIFQACYGVPFDEFYDVKLTGTVTSKTTNLPIQGIKVIVNDESHNMGITDENGKFEFYASVRNCLGEYSDTVSFIDIDGIENGCFADRTIIINPANQDEVKINVELEEKDCE